MSEVPLYLSGRDRGRDRARVTPATLRRRSLSRARALSVSRARSLAGYALGRFDQPSRKVWGTEKRGFQGVHHNVTTHLCHCLFSARVGVTLLQGPVGVEHMGRDRGRVTPANLIRSTGVPRS